jgi:hypothetical protein
LLMRKYPALKVGVFGGHSDLLGSLSLSRAPIFNGCSSEFPCGHAASIAPVGRSESKRFFWHAIH